MKKNFKLLFIAVTLLSVVMFTSCKDDEITTPKFSTLTDYLVANNLDLPSILTSDVNGTPTKFVAFPSGDADVPTFIAKYHIIDIRKAADYALGHIQGAVNKPDESGSYLSVLNEAKLATKPILVVCYSGQTACFVTGLLRLYGYPSAQALKWGMSGWNKDFDKWTSKIGDIAVGNSNWVTTAAPTNVIFSKPVISALADEGSAILKERVEAVLSEGFKTVVGTDVLATPANYHINNFFSETDYLAFGHINGAYRINPLTVGNEEILGLDPTKKIVTYCYTGQTSGIITGYLRVLGYDAYSLLNGMNALNNSSTAWNTAENSPNKWTATKSKSWTVVTN